MNTPRRNNSTTRRARRWAPGKDPLYGISGQVDRGYRAAMARRKIKAPVTGAGVNY